MTNLKIVPRAGPTRSGLSLTLGQNAHLHTHASPCYQGTMAKVQPGAGAKILAVITPQGDGVRLTLRSVRTRRKIAVVEGSNRFVRKALRAVGLFVAPPPVARLTKHRDGPRVPLVRRKPAHRHL